MKKIIIRVLIFGFLAGGLFMAITLYNHFKEKERRAPYYENLTDTSSPTVSVLRDSILIGYQNEKRTIHIYVPPDYEKDSLKRYPVLYLMDGESAFNDLETNGPEWQVDEVINQAFENGDPTAIVIAINQSKDRDAEYTPFKNNDIPNAHGADYANWVANDLKSWVDTQFRTLADANNTGIGGISRSGMMAYYMFMAFPEVFGKALVQSPSIWVDHDRLMEMDLTKEELEGKKIFVSVGEKEGYPMGSDAEEIFKKFQAKGLKDDQIRLEVIPDEGHWHITWRKSFALAYPWMM